MTMRVPAGGIWLLLVLWLMAAPAFAHEARPAYLQLQQRDAETWEVLWKVPGQGDDRRLALDVEFAPGSTVVEPMRTATASNAFVHRWAVRRAGGFDGTTVRIAGLDATLTDVLVRIERLDGVVQTLRVSPASPQFAFAIEQGRGDVAKTYLALGVEHILGGIDHLLFVFALVLLVVGTRRLVWTITAFTAAHSLTLAAATLGWLQVPPPPVEASIALSIVFLAAEILRARAGRPGLTTRAPWIVAFLFGLLHGLGFAGALSEVGLPANAIPLALLFFNVGVEIGQMLFIAAVLALMAGARRLPVSRFVPTTQHLRLASLPVYGIGTIAAFWTIERLLVF